MPTGKSADLSGKILGPMPKSEWKRMNKRDECVSAEDLRYEHDITLRGVWGDPKRVAEGF